LVLNPEDSFCAEMLKRALEELPNNDITKGVGFKLLNGKINIYNYNKYIYIKKKKLFYILYYIEIIIFICYFNF